MKKIYLLFLVAVVTINANAQKRSIGMGLPVSSRGLTMPQNGIADACNILHFPAPTSWGDSALYVFDNVFPIDSGFITGTNFYDDLEKAQYFNDSISTTDKYITKAYVGFGVAFSTNKSKVIPVNVYAANASGKPSTLLGTSSLVMKDIMNDVAAGAYSSVTFNPAIKLPASKKFFVSVDLSNLEWYKAVADTLAVFSSQANQASGAWERFYTSTTTTAWSNFPDNYQGTDLALYIFPAVSANQTCTALPVHLTSFTAEAKGKSAFLNWQVTQEVGMKEYVVEKASNVSLQFVPVGTVAAVNTPLDHSYSFTDANALNAGALLYYRLKQVNSDGAVVYSNTITLSPSNSALSVTVVNPFKNTVQLQIVSPYIQKMQGAIYDMQGRKVAVAKDQVLSAGQNSVNIPTGLLSKGVYILNITVGDKTLKYKILN